MERDLLLAYQSARERVKALKHELSGAEVEKDRAERALLDYLDSTGATATGTYNGVWAQINKPLLYARANIEDMPEVMAWLRARGHASAIKEIVHPSTLSQIVGEQLAGSGELPPKVTYYLKPNVGLYGGSHE